VPLEKTHTIAGAVQAKDVGVSNLEEIFFEEHCEGSKIFTIIN
jgi:hypothetical protein